jgi:hypothetical protein
MEEPKLYGVGKFFQIVQDNLYLSRVVCFCAACAFATLGFSFPFFFFIFIELFIYFAQYLGPIIDRQRKEKFNRWVDDQIKATGSETAMSLNMFLDGAWQPLFPESWSPFISQIIENFFVSVLPSFFRKIKVRSFLFGKKPPKIIQAITEEQPDPSSMSIVVATVFSQDLCMTVDFEIFKIPFTLVLKDIVLYTPLRIIIETPQNANYLYLPPISSFAFTSTEDIVWLSNTLLLNGFNVGRLPLINFLWCYMIEHFLRIVLSDGDSVVLDFVTGKWSLRHVSRPHTKFSEKLFEGIADREGKGKLGRFSMEENQLAAFNEARKTLWDRIYATKIPPTKRLVQMGPNHGQSSQPLLPFDLPKPELADIEVQVNEEDLSPITPNG